LVSVQALIRDDEECYGKVSGTGEMQWRRRRIRRID